MITDKTTGPETFEGVPIVSSLAGEWRELYEERAAIREYEGGQSRADAEGAAIVEVWNRKEREA